jgi:hypothetical protein
LRRHVTQVVLQRNAAVAAFTSVNRWTINLTTRGVPLKEVWPELESDLNQ